MKSKELKIAYAIAIGAIIASLVYAVSSYHKVEKRELQQKEQTLNAIFNERLETLKRTAYDNSLWNDTINKGLIAKDATWVDSNIGNYLINTFKIQNTYLINPTQEVIFSFGKDKEKIYAKIKDNPVFFKFVSMAVSSLRENVKPYGFFFKDDGIIYMVGLCALTYEETTGARTLEEQAYLVLVQPVSEKVLADISVDYSIPLLSYQESDGATTLQIHASENEQAFTLYFQDPHNFLSDMGLNLLTLTFTIFAFLYLIVIIHKKWNQSQKLLVQLAHANEELSQFNYKLEEQVEKQTHEIVEKVERAEAANRAKSTFLSNMSHEFRTPLNGILGFAQMLRMNKEQTLNESQLAWVTQILNSGAMLLEIVNDVLDLARIESGRVEYKNELFQPREVFAECYELVKVLADKRDIALRGHPDTDKFVFVDRNKLKQVLFNLLTNAVKYGNEGGYVQFGCRDVENDLIEIYVEDNGVGIPRGDLPLIFEPFHRVVETSSGVEGTGVGLSIVKKNAELMGGVLNVTSTFGEGTCFTLRLPAYEDENFQKSEG
ncbi:MAG: hypothetical protein HWE34_08670 [Methylocystaceae bacterium]|nr:hypothetical protein [Methylocystaceae bacterium]